MAAGLISFLVGVVKPLAEIRKRKQEGEGNLPPQELGIIIIKTIGFWGVLAMLLFAMSKGILSLGEIEEVIKVIKE